MLGSLHFIRNTKVGDAPISSVLFASSLCSLSINRRSGNSFTLALSSHRSLAYSVNQSLTPSYLISHAFVHTTSKQR